MIKGIPMQEILIEHGIDPDILGISRVYGITYRLRQYGKREEGFIDLRKQNSRKPAVETKEQTLATRVMQLEHELAYTQQEVEFLKKSTRQIWRRGRSFTAFRMTTNRMRHPERRRGRRPGAASRIFSVSCLGSVWERSFTVFRMTVNKPPPSRARSWPEAWRSVKDPFVASY